MTPTLEYSAIKAPKHPLAELMHLAGPTIAQMASYTVMHFIDTLMLSRVGDESAAAAGTAGVFSFAPISFGVGVLMLVNTVVSQDFGGKGYHGCGGDLWPGNWGGVPFWAGLRRPYPLKA